jgi:multidrug resistance efflux pump
MSLDVHGTAREETRANEAVLLELLHALFEHADLRAGTTEFLSRLALRFDCDRVSLGLVAGRSVKLGAISHCPGKIEATALPEVVAAMEESLLQDAALAYPRPLAGFPYIVVAHGRLADAHGLASALTVPFGQEGRLIGALCFESTREAAFAPEAVTLIQQLARHAGPLLKLKCSLQQPWPLRIWHSLRNMLAEEDQTRRRTLGTAAGLIGLCLIGLFAIPVAGTVSGQARLEASVQRLMSAPIDGFLKEVRVLPGDRVQERQVLAELNDETLLTEYRKLEAEASQQENYLAEAMVKADRTQLALRRAKLDEVLAEKDLVEQQLERIRMVAPFDGVVIKGDLTQLLGSPLKRGDILLTLSQGAGFRVIVDVPERDISDIAVGQQGTLVLTALPAERYPVRIVRITPVASVATDGQNVFEVEAALQENAPDLVPGMKGVAKIVTQDRPLGWKWVTRAWHALGFLIWSRLG